MTVYSNIGDISENKKQIVTIGAMMIINIIMYQIYYLLKHVSISMIVILNLLVERLIFMVKLVM